MRTKMRKIASVLAVATDVRSDDTNQQQKCPINQSHYSYRRIEKQAIRTIGIVCLKKMDFEKW